ncbi:alpha-ketoacid dehydrogenase subunit beta [Alteribacter keqinensis]|uniref:Alpha-ketoacid dehydrogenase subunit beta n=1 Tax=Alteribacter keqinensis TaxID=2483800 RepID=A0A3M7TXX7_9BACI|nr:alpha-ketoacid dehydrogenase subunit beta [Alteribacter keqinensis]RNA69752.1 alpha-ketoacid dehydrogenase subunit beta [Alteribacter keqinensis]
MTTKTMTEVKTNKLTLVQAVTDGMRTMMKEHDDILVLGEDVGQNGGVFRATEGLVHEFGEDRVIDTPLAEAGIVGTSIGLAINGFRPIAEMQFLGFVYPAYEQIMTHASRIRSRTMSKFSVPMVIRAPYGGGIRAPEIHSDSVEALFTHMPGIKVVVPSNPYDAKGLLIAAIEDPDPVLFMEPMRSYRAFKADVPESKYTVEIGKAATLTEGEDVTVIAWGNMVSVAQKAVEQMSGDGVSCELLDLRTLYPLDRETIVESVKKTGRVVIIHEAPETGGAGNDVMALINDEAFLYLRAPMTKVAGFDAPFPFFALEEEYLPTPARVKHAIKEAVTF